MYFKQADKRNFTEARRAKTSIKYLVCHYDANNGATARNNIDCFATHDMGASAHYFVDATEICCSVPWDSIAWHCGAKNYVHSYCRNANSIGVELCSRKDGNGNYYFDKETLNNGARFFAFLMKDYNIPIDRVVRHYDVTGKKCPAPLIDGEKWNEFKKLILSYYNGEEIDDMKYYEKLTDVPTGEMREVVTALVNRGTIKGTGSGIHLSEDNARLLVYLHREGVIK